MARIAVLSEQLINKIAAGEVVERPASVIKELCENALDALAHQVKVSVWGGGLTRLSVEDDGSGMSRPDAILSLTRHATSKLKDLDGLFSIETLGFRGEALPAIASVSRFSLTTAEAGAEAGTRLTVEGGGPIGVQDAAPAPGTAVLVEDLFFNTPARRKFMRRESTEKKHCEEAVIRLALAHPTVGFSFHAEGQLLWSSPANAGLQERMAIALGEGFRARWLTLEERRLGVTVTGYAASGEFSLPNARGLYTFVNRRYVRDRGLNAALQRAFQDTLPYGRQPAAAVLIEIDPRAVDVNVHPQKLEVRFSDGQGVCEAVFTAVRRALAAAAEAGEGSAGVPTSTEASYAFAVDRFLSQARGTSPPLPLAMDAPPAFGQARPQLNQAPPKGYFSSLRFLGSLGRRFWICEGRGATLAVVDPHAALERALLSELRRSLFAGTSSAQRSLFGASVGIPARAAQALIEAMPALAKLGFDVEPFGGNSFAVKAVPKGFEAANVQALLSDLAPVLPKRDDLAPGPFGPALRVLACHGATALEREPSREEAAALMERLEAADFHLETNHASVVLMEVPFLELERKSS